MGLLSDIHQLLQLSVLRTVVSTKHDNKRWKARNCRTLGHPERSRCKHPTKIHLSCLHPLPSEAPRHKRSLRCVSASPPSFKRESAGPAFLPDYSHSLIT